MFPHARFWFRLWFVIHVEYLQVAIYLHQFWWSYMKQCEHKMSMFLTPGWGRPAIFLWFMWNSTFCFSGFCSILHAQTCERYWSSHLTFRGEWIHLLAWGWIIRVYFASNASIIQDFLLNLKPLYRWVIYTHHPNGNKAESCIHVDHLQLCRSLLPYQTALYLCQEDWAADYSIVFPVHTENNRFSLRHGYQF